MSGSENQASAPPSQPVHPDHTVKAKPGASWKSNEQHVVPKNRLGIVFLGLCCCTFLAAIDQVLYICGLGVVPLVFIQSLLSDNRCHRFTHDYCATGWRKKL